MEKNFSMTGTTGNSHYIVIAYSERARIGVLPLYGFSRSRIRLEPETALAPLLTKQFSDWSQPQEGNVRFSTEAFGKSELKEALKKGLKALRGKELHLNPQIPEWIKNLAITHASPLPDEKDVFTRATTRLYDQLRGGVK